MAEQHPFTMPAHRREPSVELGSADRRELERSHGSYGGFRDLFHPTNHSPPPFPREREEDHDDFAGRRWIDERRPQRELPRRYPGDGFDFRRPVMSNAERGREGREERHEREDARRGAERVDLDGDEELPDVWNRAEDDTGLEEEQIHAAMIASRDERVHAEPRARAQRLPHYSNAIIDLVSDDEDDNAQPPPQPQQTEPRQWRPQYDPAHHPRTSALRHPRLVRQATPAPMEFFDLEFLGSNPITRQSTPATMATAGSTRVPTNPTIDLTAEDEDEDADLFITETRPARPGINNARPDIIHPDAGARDDDEELEEINYGGPLARLAGLVRARAPAGYPGRLIRAFQHAQANDGNEVARMLPELRENYHGHHDHLHQRQELARARANRLHRHRQIVAQRPQNYQPYPGMHNLVGPGPMPDIAGMPGMMDYGNAAFDLGLQPRQPSPTYEAPKQAEKGFTMSPGEEEIVVCPNCGDELAVAGDGEKGQVWVIRGCGHAYCGTCMANRNKGGSRKGKARITDPSPTLPFKSCVVEDCKRKVTTKDVIHVYMSS
nr:hypothetical protein B0A51_08163 [Rachicladosporium sp. CCFEE 5018]